MTAVLPDSLEQLRLAAALAHSAVDADVEICGPGRRWLVSYGRPSATIDPCGLRQLVLAARRGCRSALLPVESISFVGGLREIGGGVYERFGPKGLERRIATVLPSGTVKAMLEAVPDAADLTANVSADEELGATVVTLTSAHPVHDFRLDTVAYRVAAVCLVGELMGTTAPSRP